jgi:hypothetical protein
MSWRRAPRTLNEELLAEGPREADPEAAAARGERHEAQARLMRLAPWIIGALVFLSLKWFVEFLPPWLQIVAGTLVVAHYLSIFLRSTKRRSVGAAKGLRGVFLVWLAVCVAVTVLVAIGGFQPDDRVLLGVVWPILGLIWIGYRLRASRRLRDEPQWGSTDDDRASVLLGPGRAPTPSR